MAKNTDRRCSRPRFHLNKKVITFIQLRDVCGFRECDTCKHRMFDCGVCTQDGVSKASCPVWNGELENLLIISHNHFNDLEMEDIDGEGREVSVVKPEKRFTED